MRTESTPPFEPGALLYDPARGGVGEYRDRSGPYAMLRPLGGGREWQADPAALRPATAEERLSAEVRAANDRTRAAGLCAPDPEDLSRPPLPVRGCAACTDLAVQRRIAQAEGDLTGETDANVLLRRHQRQEHRA
ncbi:hypothetical protein ABZ858_05425 [Streptomyces sp. NPDC047017]|uniref:hypothetical protein n=1 Tax=Streptomyces sp. NPDC047017 TaxID=3155024 RepID=UPI0033F414E4